MVVGVGEKDAAGVAILDLDVENWVAAAVGMDDDTPLALLPFDVNVGGIVALWVGFSSCRAKGSTGKR